MKEKFITCIAFIRRDPRKAHHLKLTKNEFLRALRRFSREVDKVRREDIKDKRAITIDNGRSLF